MARILLTFLAVPFLTLEHGQQVGLNPGEGCGESFGFVDASDLRFDFVRLSE